jgi:Mn2+/Fe2+ NRAMP family transporter
MGRTRLSQRQGATENELRATRKDIFFGMLFSNVIMYFIILSTSAALHKTGVTNIDTAAQAAEALHPIAGNAAGYLFALGVVAVGFLAVPVMTTGAAYDLAQTFGWKHGLGTKPREAKAFYGAIAGFTILAVGINFLGFNPMKVLVWSGIAQGFSTPPLMLLILLITNNKRIMGDRANGLAMKILGWITTASIFAATAGLVVSWFL